MEKVHIRIRITVLLTEQEFTLVTYYLLDITLKGRTMGPVTIESKVWVFEKGAKITDNDFSNKPIRGHYFRKS